MSKAQSIDLDRLGWQVYNYFVGLYSELPVEKRLDEAPLGAKSEGLAGVIETQPGLGPSETEQTKHEFLRIWLLPGGTFACIDDSLRKVKDMGNNPGLVISTVYFYGCMVEVGKIVFGTYILEKLLLH